MPRRHQSRTTLSSNTIKYSAVQCHLPSYRTPAYIDPIIHDNVHCTEVYNTRATKCTKLRSIKAEPLIARSAHYFFGSLSSSTHYIPLPSSHTVCCENIEIFPEAVVQFPPKGSLGNESLQLLMLHSLPANCSVTQLPLRNKVSKPTLSIQ